MNKNGVITIRFEEGGKTPGPQPIDPSKPTPDAEKVTDNSVMETAVMSILLTSAAKQIKSITVDEVMYQLHKYYELSDNYLGRQNMDISLDIINKAWNIGTSMVFGAKLGSKAGWAGAIVGAAIAGGISAIQLSQQVSHNYEQQNIRLTQMDAQLSFNRQRAGYSLTAGSIGENR